MELTPAQKEIAKDRHRFRVVNCGRRFGKSTLAAWEMIGFATAYEDARVPYYAPTRDDARDIMWGMIQKQAGDLIVDKNESRLELVIRNRHGGTSLIALYGWEAVKERKKGVGVKNNFIVLDEVAKYRGFKEGWEEVLIPTLTDLEGDALFISTPNGFNHFYDLYNREGVDKDFKSFHFTSFDNPHLPHKEIEGAKARMSEDRFSQEYLADFRKSEGLVYKEFDRTKHLYEELPDMVNVFTPEGLQLTRNQYQRIAGVDFGYRNPAVVLDIRFDGSKLWIEDEWYKTERTDAEVADYVAIQKFSAVYPDPENAGAIEELRRRNVRTKEVVKGPGSIISGIQSVREMLIRGDIMVNKRCLNLISEFEMYSYDEDRGDRNEFESPIKKYDHALDALRYVVLSLLPLIQRQEYANAIPIIKSSKKKSNPAF